MKTKPKAYGDRVIIQPDEKIKTPSGLLYYHSLGTLSTAPETGEVVSIGDKVTDLKEGDRVGFPRGKGLDLEHEILQEDKYLVMREEDVMYIIT